MTIVMIRVGILPLLMSALGEKMKKDNFFVSNMHGTLG